MPGEARAVREVRKEARTLSDRRPHARTAFHTDPPIRTASASPTATPQPAVIMTDQVRVAVGADPDPVDDGDAPGEVAGPVHQLPRGVGQAGTQQARHRDGDQQVKGQGAQSEPDRLVEPSPGIRASHHRMST